MCLRSSCRTIASYLAASTAAARMCSTGHQGKLCRQNSRLCPSTPRHGLLSHCKLRYLCHIDSYSQHLRQPGCNNNHRYTARTSKTDRDHRCCYLCKILLQQSCSCTTYPYWNRPGTHRHCTPHSTRRFPYNGDRALGSHLPGQSIANPSYCTLTCIVHTGRVPPPMCLRSSCRTVARNKKRYPNTDPA